MDNLANVQCFACGQAGHLKAACPQRHPHLSSPIPAQTAIDDRDKSFAAHMARIEGIVTLWTDGVITMEQKREAIAAENYQFYGGHKTRGGICLTRP